MSLSLTYLSKEGFPYRIFETAHPELVKAAKKLKIEDAIQTILKATSDFPPKKTASMFKLCLTEAERRHIVSATAI